MLYIPGHNKRGTSLTVVVEEGNEESLHMLYNEARQGDIIEVNSAKVGEREIRPQELIMRQLKYGARVDLNHVLVKNIGTSRTILSQLVDDGASRIVNDMAVLCPCCEKIIKLSSNGRLPSYLRHMKRMTKKHPSEERSQLLSRLKRLMNAAPHRRTSVLGGKRPS